MTRPVARRSAAHLWVFPLIGVAAAVIGLIPWLITGARLPLQNLWATFDDLMPFVLLPFSQYAVTLIFSLLIVGAAVAGIAGRATGTRTTRWAGALVLAGVLVVHLVAVVQTAVAVAAGLADRADSAVYLVGLTGGTLTVIAVGALVTALIARAPRAGALIGLTLGAIALGPWVARLIVPFGAVTLEMSPLLTVVPWIAPVLTGIAIAWAGIGSVGRVVAALGSVALVWIVPAVSTGAGNALGTRALAHDLPGMLEYGIAVFRAALFTPELALRPVLATVIVAALGLGVRALLTRRNGRSDAAAGAEFDKTADTDLETGPPSR